MRLLSVIMLLLIMIVANQAFGAENGCFYSQNRYELPANIGIKIESTNNGKLSGVIKPLTGIPKDINIRFLTSESIVVETAPISLDSLKEEHRFSISCLKKGQTKGQWLKVLVEYLPDFDSLMNKITDSKAYPDPQLRLRLIKKVNSFSRLSKKFTEATFYRFPEVNNK